MKDIHCFAFSKTSHKLSVLLQTIIPDLKIFMPKKFSELSVETFDNFKEKICYSYLNGHPIIGICATGILIKSLAPVIGRCKDSVPVVSISEDGRFSVPLLGAGNGANILAQKTASFLHGTSVITTSGEIRFGINLLVPPPYL